MGYSALDESRLLDRLLNGTDIDDFDLCLVNWVRFVKRASTNRLLYFSAKQLLQLNVEVPELKTLLEAIVAQGEERRQRLVNTLRQVNQRLEGAGISYLVVKTYRPYPFVTNDVDVLVHGSDLEAAQQALADPGMTFHRCESKIQSDIRLPDCEIIDLHTDFNWQRSTFLDIDWVWNQPEHRDIEGVNCPVPNDEVDLCISIAHVLFERGYLSLAEIDWLERLVEAYSWSGVFEQADRHGWGESAREFARFFEQIRDLRARGQVCLPVLYPYLSTLRTFAERWRRRGYVPWYDLAYRGFAAVRFRLTSGLRVPIYGHWFDFEQAM